MIHSTFTFHSIERSHHLNGSVVPLVRCLPFSVKSCLRSGSFELEPGGGEASLESTGFEVMQ